MASIFASWVWQGGLSARRSRGQPTELARAMDDRSAHGRSARRISVAGKGLRLAEPPIYTPPAPDRLSDFLLRLRPNLTKTHAALLWVRAEEQKFPIK